MFFISLFLSIYPHKSDNPLLSPSPKHWRKEKTLIKSSILLPFPECLEIHRNVLLPPGFQVTKLALWSVVLFNVKVRQIFFTLLLICFLLKLGFHSWVITEKKRELVVHIFLSPIPNKEEIGSTWLKSVSLLPWDSLLLVAMVITPSNLPKWFFAISDSCSE